MRIKLDENLGPRIAQIFRDAGHDIATVRDQSLEGIQDEALYERCRQEERCLVSLDLDFSNVLRFPPEPTAGLAVLRPTGRPTLATLNTLARQMVQALSTAPITGRLWIIELGRVRIHELPGEKE
ncbi:MAG: DUF5615 family PIN-like protein [Candidatus Rokubacteria bacterium]|nr:DUF5615 family PIN-like protein [Candidatus Rokubacteria bacterium]